jgi:hypothetical protein
MVSSWKGGICLMVSDKSTVAADDQELWLMRRITAVEERAGESGDAIRE